MYRLLALSYADRHTLRMTTDHVVDLIAEDSAALWVCMYEHGSYVEKKNGACAPPTEVRTLTWDNSLPRRRAAGLDTLQKTTKIASSFSEVNLRPTPWHGCGMMKYIGNTRDTEAIHASGGPVPNSWKRAATREPLGTVRLREQPRPSDRVQWVSTRLVASTGIWTRMMTTN
ncbi:hypothetical protein BX600DRAFT_45634 [Xylariales sp. PMI_506]|nr:hypothetical protein BX600DRAFT_45634 [Xylariales sp. PMI_506]